jgi:hypothetical protein
MKSIDKILVAQTLAFVKSEKEFTVMILKISKRSFLENPFGLQLRIHLHFLREIFEIL